jgi:hypothetical protein
LSAGTLFKTTGLLYISAGVLFLSAGWPFTPAWSLLVSAGLPFIMARNQISTTCLWDGTMTSAFGFITRPLSDVAIQQFTI